MNFEEVYQEYVDTVYSFLKFKIHDQYLVEDILQETFLAVYKALPTLEKRTSIKSWILSITHNKMVDKLRQFKGETPKEIDDHVIDERSSLGEDSIFIEELLGQLDDVSQKIIYGVYVEGLSYRDLADILAVPEGTVKSRCYYARKKLKDFLSKGEIV